MPKNVLILGASGTAGSAIFRSLSRHKMLRVTGTRRSPGPRTAQSTISFSLESPDGMQPLLEQVRPDVIISALRGDFERQLAVHECAAAYLRSVNGKLIYLSTANVFDGSMDRPHYEFDARISNSAYGQFKIRCEDLLQDQLGEQAVLLRLPFIWGRNSPRMQAVKAGCAAGQLAVYAGLWSNHVSLGQLTDWVQWIIQDDKTGIFHVGTSDVIAYPEFVERLIAAMDLKQPAFAAQEAPGTMAVLSGREDIPEAFRWDTERLIRYLCGRESAPAYKARPI